MSGPSRGGKSTARSRSRSGGGRRGDNPEKTLEKTLVSFDKLRWDCPPLKSSKRVPTAVSLLGQVRPMEALRTGLSLYARGYNLVVSGLSGSGRTRLVKALIEETQPLCRLGPDRAYVHDFRDPYRPRLIHLPQGKGSAFRDEVTELGVAIHEALLAALRSRPHRLSQRVIQQAAEDREQRIMDALAREARKLGCELVRFQSQGGATVADIYPLHDGEPITLDSLSRLVLERTISERQRDRLLRARKQLMERLEEVSDRVRKLARRNHAELRDMDLEVARRVLGELFRDFKGRWPQAEVADWLLGLGAHIERDLERWVSEESEEPEAAPEAQAENGETADAGTGEHAPPANEPPPETRFGELEVFLIHGERGAECPVLVETNPTCANLFGTIEPPKDGQYSLAAIHPGAMLRADGGFLILRVRDVLREPGVWHLLKRALQNGTVEIREYDQSGATSGGLLQPEPIPVDLKVVLIGEPGTYEHLAYEDPDFQQIFKVHAEFDSTLPRNASNLRRYADFLSWLCGSEGLRSLAPDACAAVAEYGARSAGRQDRLTTRFSELADVAREASWLCEQAGPGPVRRRHVEAALRARDSRVDLSRELVERDFSGGNTAVTTRGKAVGQINALTVLETGTFAFGRVCRITANTGAATASRSGLVNIEGEAELSGPIHDKGVLILEGFLLQEFAGEGPLCLQAAVCFEQLYNGVEGDSATLAQLLAILSSLTGFAANQGCAVTGSMNQKGEIQIVGGINEKIEGFYRLCRARRLSGQLVILPRANLSDLMLDREVQRAVREGKFAVHAIDRIEDAAEIVLKRPWREIADRVTERLERFRVAARELGHA